MKINHKKGFSLIEMLFYTAGIVIVLGAIVYLLMQMYGIYKKLAVEPRVDRVGITIVDRITRDIRTGDSIDLSNSELNIDEGTLTINSFENETPVTKLFSFASGRVTYTEDSGEENFLTPSDMTVTRLYFVQATSTVSQAMKVELDITYTADKETKTKSFNGFAILRHSYE